MQRYEVIQSKVWKRDDGRTASIYGACPWYSTEEKQRWELVVRGWTIRDNNENTVGMCRVPFKVEQEAIEYCAGLNARYQQRVVVQL